MSELESKSSKLNNLLEENQELSSSKIKLEEELENEIAQK
jgi:hypothetical protein